ETAALVEQLRESLFQSDEEVIRKALKRLLLQSRETSETPSGIVPMDGVGCDLGQGAVLAEGETIYLFRYRASLDSGRFEGVATARGGKLYIGAEEVVPSRGSLVQPALQFFQRRLNDVSPSRGGFVVLDAWDYWYVKREGQYTRVGDLRDPRKIKRRKRRRKSEDRALFRGIAD
ncbi:MAG: hypothetical protein MI741_24495, partial [Rhodospirillales bacterium]|nr:hypothetical protein [Rhodospirillales bacterium]